MNTMDEISLEEHRYFHARLSHLESRDPAALLNHLNNGTLTAHLRRVTSQAIRMLGDLVMNKNLPQDQADELVMNQIVADPKETSRLANPQKRATLARMLVRYQSELPLLPRTYLSQSETIE